MSRPIVRANSSVAASFLARIISALARTWVLALLWLVVLVYAVRFAVLKLPAPPTFTDFNHFYVAALAVRMGSNPYITDLDTLPPPGLELGPVRIENQPPTLLLCFEVLTRLDPYTAYWIWAGICLASLVIALCLLLGETSLDPRQAFLFGAMLFLCPVVYEHFYYANMQIVITLVAVIAMCCMSRGADRWAGLPLALATALKAYPAFLAIYLVCRGRWRTLRWMAIWGSIIGLVTLWRVGLISLSFLNTFGFTTARSALGVPGFVSIDSMVSRLFWRENVTLAPSMDMIRRAAVGVVELAVFVLTVSATASAKPDRGWRSFSLWVTAMVLLSPVGEPPYLILLMIPFASIADAAARGEAEPRVIYAAIGSYLVTFSRYPLTLLHHFALGSVAFFWIANQFWSLALVLAYLAAYWLVTAQKSTESETSFALAAAAAPGEH